jgi:hypothetical protein
VKRRRRPVTDGGVGARLGDSLIDLARDSGPRVGQSARRAIAMTTRVGRRARRVVRTVLCSESRRVPVAVASRSRFYSNTAAASMALISRAFVVP